MSEPEYEITVRIETGNADGDRLESAIRYVLSSHQAPPGSGVTLVVTDSETVRNLNRQFRGVDAPTDVLAFQSGPTDLPDTEGERYLGDIVISYPVAASQAEEGGHDVMAELILLTVHGTLHLLGYDHESEAERSEMWAAQSAALEALGVGEIAPD